MNGINEKDIEVLLKCAVDFLTESLRAREHAKEQYKKNETNDENSIRALIDGLIAKLALKMTAKIEHTTPEISYQLGLSASFIRTHFLISELFMNGDILEAITLIRKQLESVTRMYELDSKPLQKVLKKTPNVQKIFRNSGKKTYPLL